jgi:isopentenyl-diphosphate Delta-isomerase
VQGRVKGLSGLEEVDLVDNDDAVIGAASLGVCLAKGLLHRAVAVLVLRSTGSVVLQRRSESDLWNPGLWTISCTGHVKSGESYAEAAARELSEELGLTSPVHQLFKFKLPPIRDRTLTENEWTAFFSTVTDAKVTPDPQELSGVEEVPMMELERMVRGGPLTEDAKILLTNYLQHQGDYPSRTS